MDWLYLFGPSAFQIAAGFVIAKLFEFLSDIRQDRRVERQIAAERERVALQLASESDRLSAQLASEKERIDIQQRGELRKRLFEVRFETALGLTRLLQGTVQSLRTQMLLHAATYSEGRVDVEMFRRIRDDTFESIRAAVRDGENAAAVADLLFGEAVTFSDLPHHRPLIDVRVAWDAFLREQDDFLAWLDTQKREISPMLPQDQLAAIDGELSARIEQLRTRVGELMKLTDAYHDGVSGTIRILRKALEP